VKEFDSPGSFAKHLLKLAAVHQEVDKHILEKAAEDVRVTAAGMIGQYQEAAGPFVKWEELADSTEKEKTRLGYSLDAPLLRNGKLKKSIEKTLEPTEAAVGSNNPVMVYQELGTEHIPPRSTLGSASVHSAPRVCEIAAVTAVAWLSGVGWRRPGKILNR